MEIIKQKLRSIELCMSAHPDNEKHSEFADRIEDLKEIPLLIESKIEQAHIEGVLTGLKICKEMVAQGTISHGNIRENEVFYQEELDNLKQNKISIEKESETDIKEENLIADGWRKLTDIGFLFEKPIENRNPLNSTPVDTDILLVVHNLYNSCNFAVLFPSGAMLNFIANSMKELKDFENSLLFYDCEY